jgi:polar amino acid transport system permease protein
VTVLLNGGALSVLAAIQFNWEFFWRYLLQPSGFYIGALGLTIVLAVVSQFFGAVLGTITAMGRLSNVWVFNRVAGFYTWIMRGTPLLVQIVFVYTALPAAGIFRFSDISFAGLTIPGNIEAGVIALSINEGAYMGEIIRAGILSVDPGQAEAAKSLGMTYWMTMRGIILPQAARVIVPPLGNDFNAMLKSTTLVSVIGVQELLFTTQTLTATTFRVFELYLVVALYYLLLTTIWGQVQNRIEARLGVYAKGVESVGFVDRMVGRFSKVEH